MIIGKQRKQINLFNKALVKARHADFYRARLKDFPLKIKKLSDIELFPLITKQDLRDCYPFGILAVPMDNVIEMHTTSGTTGKATLSYFTKKDLLESSKAISRAWKNFGINNKSRVQFMMGYGLFSGAPLNTYAIQSLGAFVLPAGIQSAVKQVQLMQDFKIDTIVATPSYYLYLYDYIQQNGIPLKSLHLKTGIAAGEVYSNELKNKIAELFSIRVFDHYGLCEVNTGIIYECKKCGDMVVIDDYVYPEVVDPITGNTLKEGEKGELVLTSFKKEASPVIRYKTGDIISIKSFSSKCSECYGSITLDRIRSRHDLTIFYKGIKLEPFELRDMVMSFMGDKMYRRFRIQVNENVFAVKPKILISLQLPSYQPIIEELKNYLKAMTGVLFDIENVPYSYFGDFIGTKEKIVEYIKQTDEKNN